MRVPTITTFGKTTYQLGRITTNLNAANTAVVTGKRINTLSDDPVGLSQVLSIRSSLSNIDQLARNIATGRTWLNAGEAALGTAKDLITEAKTLSIQMVNGGVSDAVDHLDRKGLGLGDQVLGGSQGGLAGIQPGA
ncbi:MAG: hypothetical protein R6X05_13935, partial [Desulfobacterales bacterium]